jgi:glycosyltransferase involved in cell wall biosynthesis
MKKISIVTPCFNEEETIQECYETVRDIFADELPDYEREHVFCDNASTDRTVDILRDIADDDENVKVIVNSRNFGPFRSNLNGVLNTTGDVVLLFLPADLQDPPELLPQFVSLWESSTSAAIPTLITH